MHTVVVESPAKAKTINKYLGKDYYVLASFGHVRDLPSKDGSVRPDEDFAMDYQLEDSSKKHMAAIVAAVKGADTLYLATDPDREGEAISWHIVEALKEKKALPKSLAVKRITFTEITKNAVQYAVAHPREIDMDLVNAQQARRALDYLVGFNLSPVLWRKLPGAKSAGRVQSVALRLICQRDEEIEAFVAQEYWDISALLASPTGVTFNARLTQWNGEKLEKFTLTQQGQAEKIVAALNAKNVTVKEITPKQMRRNPYPPFTTSTLQMDASRKLGFGAKKTMTLAQKLYEGVDIGGETVGLISYMRTDGVQVSEEAIQATRKHIEKAYGKNYLPENAKRYTSKAKNAQEAHEAIRPTDISRTPDSVARYLEGDMLRLYELVWKRMVASQMEPAVYDQLSIELSESVNNAMFRATGSLLKFDGFLKLYREGIDDDQKDEEESAILPAMNIGDSCPIRELKPEQHFTEPPPRYSEASLVKRLEELGIGRPSTYAAIISVLQDRGYVRLDKKRFIAEMRGRLVSAFLVSYFQRYVEYDFTANLEEQLDEISAGKMDWKVVLRAFWDEFIARITESKEIPPKDVLETLDTMLAPFIFGKAKVTTEDRLCPQCKEGGLHLKTGKFGAFLGCNRYPDCNYTKPLNIESDGGNDGAGGGDVGEFPRALGTDPKTGLPVSLRKGPYGVYAQLGEGKEVKRASVAKGVSADTIDLEKALSMLALPREVGEHPETGKMIMAGVGRFGPYLQHDGKYVSLKGDDDVLTIGMNRAVDLIAENAAKASGKPGALRTLGKNADGDEVSVFSGRYGPYVKAGKVNATIPKGYEPETITLEEATVLLAARAGAGGKSKGKKPAAKKAAPKKAAAKPKAEAKPKGAAKAPKAKAAAKKKKA